MLLSDSTSAIAINKNLILHECTKHIEVDIHLVREKVVAGVIELKHVPMEENIVDGFTKSLGIGKFHFFWTN